MQASNFRLSTNTKGNDIIIIENFVNGLFLEFDAFYSRRFHNYRIRHM